MKTSTRALLLALIVPMAGCATVPEAPTANGLGNSQWVLIGVQDRTADAELREVPLNRYTMQLDAAGRARFRFDCNNGTSSWEATPRAPGKGKLSFGRIASTMMLCGGESIGESLAADMARVTEYSIYDGKLSMFQDGDGPVYVWDTID